MESCYCIQMSNIIQFPRGDFPLNRLQKVFHQKDSYSIRFQISYIHVKFFIEALILKYISMKIKDNFNFIFYMITMI